MGKLHHLKVGCADCSVIISSNYTFLIDCHGIADYENLLPENKRIRGVFITHQHYDHFDGLGFLKDNGYTIRILIYSPYERRYSDNSVEYDEWNDFKNYRDYFEKNGTKLYTPYRQTQFDNPFWEIDGISFFILGPATHIAKSDTRELHDASLVIHAKLNKRRCLFAGDASDASLKYIADNTNNICDDILHASHHGSLNGAELDFIKSCSAKYAVISTKSGVYSNIPSDTALQRYRAHTTKEVYRTDTDGNLKWSF